MLSELNSRKEKILGNLNKLEKQPQNIAVLKGQAIENIKSAEKEKIIIESDLIKAEEIFNQHNLGLKNIQEQMMLIREKRATSIATLTGLKKRRLDLLERIDQELNLNETNLFNSSNIWLFVMFSNFETNIFKLFIVLFIKFDDSSIFIYFS